MKAIKLSATVGSDRTLVLHLPSETPEGLAEVIILVPESRTTATDVDRLLSDISQWRAQHPERRTKEAIDQALSEERNDWSEA